MTITPEEYQALLERVSSLEGRLNECLVDIERFKDAYLSSSLADEGLFNAIIAKQKKYRDCLQETMQAVMQHNRALFPERYVKGASPNLRLSLDPSKML